MVIGVDVFVDAIIVVAIVIAVVDVGVEVCVVPIVDNDDVGIVILGMDYVVINNEDVGGIVATVAVDVLTYVIDDGLIFIPNVLNIRVQCIIGIATLSGSSRDLENVRILMAACTHACTAIDTETTFCNNPFLRTVGTIRTNISVNIISRTLSAFSFVALFIIAFIAVFG